NGDRGRRPCPDRSSKRTRSRDDYPSSRCFLTNAARWPSCPDHLARSAQPRFPHRRAARDQATPTRQSDRRSDKARRCNDKYKEDASDRRRITTTENTEGTEKRQKIHIYEEKIL